jgi:hypothetical protein
VHADQRRTQQHPHEQVTGVLPQCIPTKLGGFFRIAFLQRIESVIERGLFRMNSTNRYASITLG